MMTSAYAGTAKSTTLEMAAPGIKVPALALAFNKKIATELEPRLGAAFTVKTFNGLGHGAWARANPKIGRLQLEPNKLGKLVGQVAKDRKVDLSSEQWDQLRRLVTAVMQAGITPGDQGKPLLKDTRENWTELADGLWIGEEELDFIYDLGREIWIKGIEMARAGIVSFDDQVYCSACLGGQFPQFPVVFVDEAQDLSPLNHHMLRQANRKDGRMVVVGDPKQCHPIGTMIQLSRGKSKPIEEVKIGDKIVSYNRGSGFSGLNTQGTSVTDVLFQKFSGNLVRIVTDGSFAHECTPNHRCLVKWTDKKSHLLYMMRKGNQFRIGTAQSWYTSSSKGGFGPSMRARQEKADATWVLEAYETKEEALIAEKVIWTKFGLPDLIFECSGKASSTQKHLDAAWTAIGDNSQRAKECLKYFNKEFDFPFFVKGQHLHIGEKSFLTQACNLISGMMSVKVFDGSSNCQTWLSFWVTHEPYNGIVVGLTVSSNGYGMNLYVANGIVTHNSIYGFRGAVTEGMNVMRYLKPSWNDQRLTLTFRCPKVVVERNQAHAPGFTAFHTNVEGKFTRFKTAEDGVDCTQDLGWNWAKVLAERVRDNDTLAVLCRNNGPLMSMAFKLIRQGIGPVMLGRDIGKGLVLLSRKILPEDSTPRDICAGKIEDWRVTEVSLALAKGDEGKIAGITDRAECLQAVLDGADCPDAGTLRTMLEKLFAREAGAVTLGSIHRSKGLEWDLVVHLDPWRIPSRQAREAAKAGDNGPIQQEWNLLYVAETRTKHTLINANLEDFHS
jgi:hypothetical protein